MARLPERVSSVSDRAQTWLDEQDPASRKGVVIEAWPFVLLGLDLGPNLAVTGSLSAVLWLQAARSAGARPSIATYTKLGAVLVPLTLAASVAVSSWS